MTIPTWPKNPPPHDPKPQPQQLPACETCPPGESSKTQLAAELAFALADMRNVPHIIEQFSANRDDWTEWSDSHDFLNSLLDEWQAARDA